MRLNKSKEANVWHYYFSNEFIAHFQYNEVQIKEMLVVPRINEELIILVLRD